MEFGFKQAIPAFIPLTQSITALLAGIHFTVTTEGRRLGRPRWLVTYRNKVTTPRVEPGTGLSVCHSREPCKMAEMN